MAVTKKESDGEHPSGHYLVVPDSSKPSTWALRYKDSSGKVDRELVGGAYAALTSNHRGSPYEGPGKAAALAKLKKIYRDNGWALPGSTDANMSATDMSYQELTSLLSNELNSDGSYDSWVSAVYPTYVVYQKGGEFYRCNYSIDDNYAVTMGAPEQVVGRTTYDVVQMSEFALSDPVVGEDGLIRRTGKIFEVGSYPDKGFDLSLEEALDAVLHFSPAQIDSEHKRSLFDGRMGVLEHVDILDDMRTIVGTTAMPPWTNDALGQKITVSTAWSSGPKRIKKLALAVDPRVSDAVMMSSFSKYGDVEMAGARHSAADAKDMQLIHDISTKQGAECPPVITGKSRRTLMAKFWDRFRDVTPEELAEFSQEMGHTDSGDVYKADPEKEALRARLAEFTKREAQTRAVAVVEAAIRDSKILPANRERLVLAFSRAAQDDVEHPVDVTTFSADGVEKKYTRFSLIEEMVGALPKHDLVSSTNFGNLPAGSVVVPGQTEEDPKAEFNVGKKDATDFVESNFGGKK